MNIRITGVNKTEQVQLSRTGRLPALEPQYFSPVISADSLNIAAKKAAEIFQSEPVLSDYKNDPAKINNHILPLNQMPDFTKTPFRIGLAVAQKQADFSLPGGKLYELTSEGKREILDLGDKSYKVKNENNTLVLYNQEGKMLGSYKGSLVAEDSLNPAVINGKKYRGSIEIMLNPQDPSTLHAVNNVMLEEYLKGVVPAESPASWPLESLKAQAMAARTYSIANWNKNNALGFDLAATVSDQVYKGMEVEQESTNTAVEETRNKVILFGGKPINALFFSCSGGMTDSSLEVWGVDLPYIQPVPDFDQAASRYRWEKASGNADIQKALKQLGHNIGAVKEIEPLSHTPAGRVKEIKFTGTNGSVTVDSNKFRFALGLNSTLWTVKASSAKKFSLVKLESFPKNFTFSGGGWGHGLGMSQWGARQMAADGKTGEEIVRYFYTGVEVGELYKASNK